MIHVRRSNFKGWCYPAAGELSGDLIGVLPIPDPASQRGMSSRDPTAERGFLKAIDYARAFQASDTAVALKAIADTFIFERELCEKCKNRSMDHVAHAIDSGEVAVVPGNPYTKVSYLIFALADGDIRSIFPSRCHSIWHSSFGLFITLPWA